MRSYTTAFERHTLTVYGLGSRWTDQQWLAQVFMYGVYSLGGFALLSIATCASVVGAFSIAAAAARSLGAGARAFWVMFLPVLVAAPWAWSIRAQISPSAVHSTPLAPRERGARAHATRLAGVPLLVLWANIHGSVALGALLVMLLGAYELVRTRGRRWAEVGLIVLAPLAVLATPYGPAATVRYYHLLLVDPPFAGRVTEWRWAAPATNTMFFYVLAAIAVVLVWLGRRRLTIFEARARVHVRRRGRRDPGNRLVRARLHGLPSGRDRPKLESKSRRAAPRTQPRRRAGLTVASSPSLAHCSQRSDTWFESTGRRRRVDAVRSELRPGDRVFASDRFSDWMLFRVPELRGRVAYDVRFELYDDAFFDRLQDYDYENGRLEVVCGRRSHRDRRRDAESHTADFLEEPALALFIATTT